MKEGRFYKASTKERKKIAAAIKAALQKNPEIVFAFIFGSFQDEGYFRDIDVGVFVRSPGRLPLMDYEMKLASEIEGSLPMPIPVEVKVINEAPLPFRFQVILGELLFSKDDEILERFMVGTARHYLDFAPLRQRYIKEALTS